jgi:hypothetical protein
MDADVGLNNSPDPIITIMLFVRIGVKWLPLKLELSIHV